MRESNQTRGKMSRPTNQPGLECSRSVMFLPSQSGLVCFGVRTPARGRQPHLSAGAAPRPPWKLPRRWEHQPPSQSDPAPARGCPFLTQPSTVGTTDLGAAAGNRVCYVMSLPGYQAPWGPWYRVGAPACVPCLPGGHSCLL